jgi:DNA-binding NarL/FixJ family response regulator
MTASNHRAAGSRVSRVSPRPEPFAPAIAPWRGREARRWTLIEQLESGGRRYVLARENEPQPAQPAPLSAREREVVGLAALGRSNKWIAHELGLAHSTVRVLLARAAAKLGVDCRAALIARWQPSARAQRR